MSPFLIYLDNAKKTVARNLREWFLILFGVVFSSLSGALHCIALHLRDGKFKHNSHLNSISLPLL